MTFSRIFACAFGLLVFTTQSVPAATTAGPGTVSGGTIVPVVDGNSTSCIDVTKQQVSMFIVGLKAQRYSSWFSETKQVGVKIDVLIKNPSSATNSTDFKFPTALALKPIGTGDILMLPISNYLIMTKFIFADGKNNAYANVGLSFTFVDITGASDFTSTIDNLIKFSGTLSIPANPYLQGVQDFGKFVDMLSGAEADANNAQQLAAVNSDLYDGTGACKPNELHEGTYAILYDFVPNSGLFAHHGNPPPGTLKTSEIVTSNIGPTSPGQKRYCFYLNGTGLTYAEQGAAADCQHVTGTAQPLNNPQVVVETVAYDRPAKAASGSQVVADVTNMHAAMLTDMPLSVSGEVPQSTQTTTSQLRNSLLAGHTLSESLRSMGAEQIGGHANSFAMSKDLHLSLANARAITRCQKIGVPADKLGTLCTVSALETR